MLQLAMFYAQTTPESAADGEASATGFIFDACDCTAHALARYITREGFAHPSSWPATRDAPPEWLSTESQTIDYTTGTEEVLSIHPGHDARSQKVWRRVLYMCGITQ